MALPTIDGQFYPTPEEVLSQVLADLRFSFDTKGVVVNVRPGSEHYMRADAFAKRVAIAIRNGELSADQINPLTATGDDLTALAGVFGVVRRGASQAAGPVIITVSSSTVPIPAGFEITAPSGELYTVTTSASYSDGDFVEIISTNTGAEQNVPAGTVMTWNSSAFANLQQTATVASSGIANGNPEDDDETLRRRLLERLSFPAGGGNAPFIITLAENASASVQKAFAYAAARGPGSYDVTVVARDGDRAVSTAFLSTIAAAIVEDMPGHTDLNLTTTQAELVDLFLQIRLPKPVNAGGAGGGFLDAVQWPSNAETGPNVFAEITAVDVALNTITVNSTSANPPVIGNRFHIWNATKDNGIAENGLPEPTGGFEAYTVALVTGSSGAYVITIDTSASSALTFVETELAKPNGTAFCTVGADKMVEYGNELRDAFLLLGPGEKTDSPDILPRGRRQPEPGLDWPQRITARQSAGLLARDPDTGIAVFPEVEDIEGVTAIEHGTSFNGTGTFTAKGVASIPATTADAPRILVIQNLMIRALVN